jgi:hypothetical protein
VELPAAKDEKKLLSKYPISHKRRRREACAGAEIVRSLKPIWRQFTKRHNVMALCLDQKKAGSHARQ